MPNHKQQDNMDFVIVTRIPEEAYKFQWIVQQFTALPKNKSLYSTRIDALPTSCYLKLVKYEHGFCLFHVSEAQMKATIKANHRGKSGFCRPRADSSEASNESSDEFTLNLEYQVSVTDCKGNELMKWSACFSDDSEYESRKIGEYSNNSLERFPDDSLILNCNLKVTMVPITEEIPIASETSLEDNSWQNLSTDFKALYQSSQDTDVTLVAGTNKIHAHKLILTARSTIFKKIFLQDIEEAEKNSVSIPDVDFSTLQRLVEFLYSGSIVDGENKYMNLQELHNLYYAANKYEVMDLREMVGNTLMERIKEENASEILVWADQYGDKDLKFRIMNFIRINFVFVSNTDEWESFTLNHPKLAIEAINFCFKTHKISTKKF